MILPNISVSALKSYKRRFWSIIISEPHYHSMMRRQNRD